MGTIILEALDERAWNSPESRARREHAMRNARYSAQLLEEDRTATRRQEILTELEELYGQRERINVRIFDLENEQDALRAPQVNHE